MLTLKELATLLRIHYSTAYRMANKGMFPGFKIGNSWRFTLEDINRWLKEQEEKSGISRTGKVDGNLSSD